jgi:FKBP-type peptidyl-prolyl cis-trans isomerase FkpA
MKKFLLLPIVLAVGFAILILINSEPGERKDEADVFEAGDAGYVATESGLKYRDVKVGDGKEVKKGDKVVVNYTGWLTDGTKFDSSRDPGKKPFDFTIGKGVIQGWSEGVAGMKVGGKRRLIIPSDLGYGPDGSPPKIPPDAELRFAIELLDTK